MGTDWDAVAAAINTRLEELEMTQQELARRSGVSVATLRQLQHNYQPKRRSPRTLAAISEGLRWPSDHLARVLEGTTGEDSTTSSLHETVDRMQVELDELRARVAQLENQQGT